MKRSCVNSSDLDLARTLLRRLATRDPAAVPAAPEEVTPYLRFHSEEAAAIPLFGPEPQPREFPSLPLEMESWEVFLAWSLELCQARAAFVVDSQGFVIASRGNVPADHFEGTGAELCLAMEELVRVDPEAGPLQALELHFRNRNVVAVRAAGEQQIYVIGYVGSRALSDEVMGAILRQIASSLTRLH